MSPGCFTSSKAFWNHLTYPGISRSRFTTSSCAASAEPSLVISIGLASGPIACSSSDFARPSQNWAVL